jgi:hypothetical protein
MIPQFAGESIRQACVTAHRGANRPILPFDKRRGNVLRVRVSHYRFHFATDALCWRVARFVLCGCAVDFVQLREINFRSELVLDGCQVWPVGIAGDLYAVLETGSDVCEMNSFAVTRSRWPSFQDGTSLLSASTHTQSQTSPASGFMRGNLFCAIFLLAVNPRPQLVQLQAF